jgi:ribosomal subunit interface protein
MELHIEGQRIDIQPELRTTITQRLEKLDAHHGDIIHARVALVKSGHHQQGSDEVRISLSMTRRKVLRVTKVGKTLENAVNNAMDALQRELSSYRTKRRELDKPLLQTAKVAPRITGVIAQIFPEQGYGLVNIDTDENIHFLRQAVAGGAFDSLTEGMAVEIEVVDGPDGYEATRVVPLQG